jgi:spore coat protein A
MLNTINFPAAQNAGAPRQLVLFEGKDEFGRLQPMLGTMADGSLTWSQPTTENPAMRSTELWEVYNATGDAHPIHLHLVKFQVVNRQEFSGTVVNKPQPQHNGSFGTGGILQNVMLQGGTISPPAHEQGWKDTFIVPPGQVGRLIATFDRPGRYVWHCHILSHEDHEMMRVFHVGPLPPSGGTKGAVVEDQDVPDGYGEFRLYPNPASDLTTVDFALEESADVTVSIYGMDGRLMNTEELGYLNEGSKTIQVPVGHLDNGMYIFELKAGDKLIRESFVVSK